MQKFMYPRNKRTKGNTVFTAAHRAAVLKFSGAWMIILSAPQKLSPAGIKPPPGKHIITLVDENGVSISRQFEILEKEK